MKGLELSGCLLLFACATCPAFWAAPAAIPPKPPSTIAERTLKLLKENDGCIFSPDDKLHGKTLGVWLQFLCDEDIPDHDTAQFAKMVLRRYVCFGFYDVTEKLCRLGEKQHGEVGSVLQSQDEKTDKGNICSTFLNVVTLPEKGCEACDGFYKVITNQSLCNAACLNNPLCTALLRGWQILHLKKENSTTLKGHAASELLKDGDDANIKKETPQDKDPNEVSQESTVNEPASDSDISPHAQDTLSPEEKSLADKPADLENAPAAGAISQQFGTGPDLAKDGSAKQDEEPNEPAMKNTESMSPTPTQSLVTTDSASIRQPTDENTGQVTTKDVKPEDAVKKMEVAAKSASTADDSQKSETLRDNEIPGHVTAAKDDKADEKPSSSLDKNEKTGEGETTEKPAASLGEDGRNDISDHSSSTKPVSNKLENDDHLNIETDDQGENGQNSQIDLDNNNLENYDEQDFSEYSSYDTKECIEKKKEKAQLEPHISVAFQEAEDSHFFAYFLTMVVLCIIGYLLFHNKQKIIALVIEGRKVRNSRKRPSSSGYRKLDNTLEEAVTSSCKGTSMNIIY